MVNTQGSNGPIFSQIIVNIMVCNRVRVGVETLVSRDRNTWTLGRGLVHVSYM
jgi:hypothetical protein